MRLNFSRLQQHNAKCVKLEEQLKSSQEKKDNEMRSREGERKEIVARDERR